MPARYFEFVHGTSAKFWEVEHTPGDTTYYRRWGRIGTTGTRKPYPFASPADAAAAMNALISEKLGEGYIERLNTSGPAPAAPQPAAAKRLFPMLAEEVDLDLTRYTHDVELLIRAMRPLLMDDGLVFEQKVDGDRVLVVVGDGKVTVLGRNGQVSKHSPRFAGRFQAASLAQLASMCKVVMLDGELVGDKLWIFDMPRLEWSAGIDLLFDEAEPWDRRRRALGLLFQAWAPNDKLFGLVPFSQGYDDKEELARRLHANHGEGVMVKDVNAPYKWAPKRSTKVRKAKYWKSVDCIVTAVNVGGKNNAVLSVYRDGKLVEIGHTSLNGKRGVAVGMVVEMKYLCLDTNNRLREPDLLRIRTDKSAEECTFAQLVKTSKEVLA